MNEKDILQASERADFTNLNGWIMRMCNILKPSERTLNAVYTLCKCDYSVKRIERSLEYLCDSGYLKIDHPNGVACLSEYEAGESGNVKIRIPAKGMQLLMGAIRDVCVEI